MNYKKITQFLAIGVAALVLSSCDKEEESTANSSQPLNEADAVEVIEEALQENSGGELKEIALMGEQMNGTVGILSNIECGVAFDTTINYSLSGSATGEYTHNWEVLLDCENGIPQSLAIDANYEGFFDGNNIDRTVEGTRNWVWTDLDPAFSVRTLNGTTMREGNRTSSIGFQNTYQWILNTEFLEVEADKETDHILGGMADLTGSLSNSNGNTYSFEGSLVFNGDGTATLTINGNIYEIELN